MKFVSLCNEGFEELLKAEIIYLYESNFSFHCNKISETKNSETKNNNLIFHFDKKGIIFFEIADDFSNMEMSQKSLNFFNNLSDLNFAEDTFIVLKKYSGINRYRSTLKNIKHQTAKVSIELLKNTLKIAQIINNKNELFLDKKVYQILIKASYIGKRDYKSLDIEKTIANEIRKKIEKIQFKNFKILKNKILFSEKKKEIFNEKKFNEEKIKIIKIHSILREDISFLGLSIKKKFDFTFVKGSLSRSIANSLIALSFYDIFDREFDYTLKDTTDFEEYKFNFYKKVVEFFYNIKNNKNKKNKLVDIKILDPMCGTGIIPISLAFLGINSYGNDINKEKIEIALKNKEKNKDLIKSDIVFLNLDVFDLINFKEYQGLFDKIICNLPYEKEEHFISKEINKDNLNKDEDLKKENLNKGNVDYNNFFENFNNLLKGLLKITKKDATFTFLSKYDLEEIFNKNINKNIEKKLNFEIIFKKEIKNSGLLLNIFVIKRIE